MEEEWGKCLGTQQRTSKGGVPQNGLEEHFIYLKE